MAGVWATIVLPAVILIITVIYLYVRHTFLYWKRRGIPSLPASFPFGNYGPTFLVQKSIGETTTDLYNSTDEPFIGVFSFLRPMLLIRDHELLRNIFIRDFQHFHDRGVFFDEKYDPLSAHLFSINGKKWKNLRVKLSPTFTSGKMKAMFSTLVSCGDPLQKYIDNIVQKNEQFEVRELAAQYATNVIASVAFGIDINCIDHPDTPFRKFGRKIFEPNLKNGFRFLGTFLFPAIMKRFKLRSVDRDVEDFMMSIVSQTLKYREESKVVRKDFFQLLVQLRNTGNVQLDDQWETVISNGDEGNKALSFNEIAAQAYVFYIAGFETSSTTMAFCMYEIAKNPEIQKKVHEEIDRVLKENGGSVTYESINDMKYLECCVDEALRMYPAVPLLNRVCTKEYTIPGTDKVIEEGTAIAIPAWGMQMDEKYYPEPHIFKPERFLDEKNKNFSEKPYMPFGEGPRICIGTRMGKTQTKVGLVLLLQKHQYKLAPQHIGKEIKYSANSFVPASAGGLQLIATQR